MPTEFQHFGNAPDPEDEIDPTEGMDDLPNPPAAIALVVVFLFAGLVALATLFT